MKYNMKNNIVMKQKIFSLLLLMFAATVGVWADETYKIQLTVNGGVDVTDNIEGVNLDSPYTVPDATLESIIRNAYGLIDTSDDTYVISFNATSIDGSQVTCEVSGGKIVISKPTSGDPFLNIATVKLETVVKKNGTDVGPEEVYVKIKLYHEQHIAVGDFVNTGDTHHWHLCGNGLSNCELSGSSDYSKFPDYAEHVYGTDPSTAAYYTCSVCGHVDNSRKPAHTHNYASDWTYNETEVPGKHWHACTSTIGECTAPRNAESDHVYDNDAHDAAYYTCSVCGFENDSRKGEHASHNYVWGWDDSKHWKRCDVAGVCNTPYEVNPAAHTFGTTGAERYTCTTAGCGYVDPTRKSAAEAFDASTATNSWNWDYEIPYAFDATNVVNQRKMNANTYYTVCLPYALKLNGLKVHYIEASSDKLVGFKEQTITELPALTPCVVQAAATGSPLNMSGGKVVKTIALTDRSAVGEVAAGTGSAKIYGSLMYLEKADAANKYIMQGPDETYPEGSFKKIADNSGAYDNEGNRACVLPMRAYITGSSLPSRQLLGVKFYGADGSTTAVDRLVLDEDDFVIYDLQGRRVQNPKKGGLYIINGRKQVMK